jgi:dihydropteroate synthase
MPVRRELGAPGPPGASDLVWRIGPDKTLTLDRPRVIAILNLTPDSFSDGGGLPTVEAALAAAHRALDAGADMLDIGGESTRPGASRVSAEVQIRRTEPVIRAIRSAGAPLATIPISIDTTLAAVARPALDAGADAINDVAAGLEDPGVLPLAAARRAGVILMHRLAPPEADFYSDAYTAPPRYGDVVAEVGDFLAWRAGEAMRAGVRHDGIVLDPGLGFGKSVEQNLELVRRTGEICRLGFPVLSGASRKSFVGRASGLTESEPRDRVAGSVAFSIAHYQAGARLFRVHDVAAHVQALRAVAAIAARPAGARGEAWS